MPTDFVKANMTNSLVNLCWWDMSPFAIVKSVKFKNVLHTAMDIDFASKTLLLANDLLQSRHTIKRITMDRFDKGIVKL